MRLGPLGALLIAASFANAAPASLAQDGEPAEEPAAAPEPARPLYAGTAQALAAAHPHVHLGTYGRSSGGRALEILTVLPSGGGGLADVEWTALVVAGLDGARDALESRVVLDVANWLAEHADRIPAGTALAFVAEGSPDACAARRSGNDTPVDEDADGDLDEDGPDDVDGDGRISFMRFPDPTGRLHVADPAAAEPAAPVWAKPSEGKARTHRVVAEGRDDDGDGLFNEDGPGGAVVARNFPWHFEEHVPAAGRWHASEPETRAIMDHLLADERIALVYEIGAAETLSKMPSMGAAWQKLPDADGELYAALRELHPKGAEELEDLDGPQVERKERAPGPGSLGATVVHQLGRAWVGRALLGWHGPSWPADDAAWPAERKIRWRPVTGAGLPAGTELGDVEPLAWTEARNARAVSEAEAAAAFLLEAAAARARVAFAATESTATSRDTVTLRTKVVNTGRLPTHTARGAELRARRPVNVRLRLPAGALLLAGEPLHQIERLGPGEASDELVWVVSGSPGATVVVEVTAPDAGVERLEVTIR